MTSQDGVAPEGGLAGVGRAPDPASRFADGAYLTYLVPADTSLEPETVFGGSGAGRPMLESIRTRDALFFDETVGVFLVLKSPWLEEGELRAQIHGLAISLEVQIANGSAPGRETPPAPETIFAGQVPDVDDAVVIVDDERAGPEDDDDDAAAAAKHVYAVWKLSVFLARPRTRPHQPSVVFVASASVKPEAAGSPAARGAGYLQSGAPASFNLLESFANDTALRGVRPRLSALRVSRVTPVAGQHERMTHLAALPRLRLGISPVVHTRIRFSRPNTVPLRPAVVALLEVDFTPGLDCEALLDDIKLHTPDGTVESLDRDAAMGLPLRCVSHDHITFLYHIKPHEVPDAPRRLTSNLDISISASVLVEPGVCTPRLCMAWSTTVDFAIPVNPSFGTTAEAGMQRSHRPSQLSIGSGGGMTPLKSPAVTQPDALPALEASTARGGEATLQDLGITVSFTGPAEPVRAGDVFSWTVYVVNRGGDRAARPPRKLALVALPRRRRNDARPAGPPSTASRRRGEKEVADAVLDDNVLHALQKSSAADAADVVCLSSDTRVGPLAPGACHVVELQFLALREGILAIDAVRVVDLGSQEHVDIRDLPTMRVEPAAA